MVKSAATSYSELASTAKPVVEHPSKLGTESSKPLVQAAFTSAAIGMSWQLAVIVLVPILGGYKLDQSNQSTPLWTLTGLILALVGSILVIRRAMQNINNFDVKPNEEKHV